MTDLENIVEATPNVMLQCRDRFRQLKYPDSQERLFDLADCKTVNVDPGSISSLES